MNSLYHCSRVLKLIKKIKNLKLSMLNAKLLQVNTRRNPSVIIFGMDILKRDTCDVLGFSGGLRRHL
jgi:hypothetical protein